MAEELENFVSRDFIYCGKRWSESRDKLMVEIHQLDGEVQGKPSFYLYDKSWKGFAPGGVYRGASFSDASIKGITSARFLRLWANPSDRYGWKALDEAAECTHRSKKVQQDVRKTNEFEEVMLPLRKAYQNLKSRRDFAGTYAMEQAILRALQAPLRADEKDA